MLNVVLYAHNNSVNDGFLGITGGKTKQPSDYTNKATIELFFTYRFDLPTLRRSRLVKLAEGT